MTHPVLDLGTFLHARWQRTLAAIRAAHESMLQTRQELRERIGQSGEYVLNDWSTRVPLSALFQDFALELERGMTRHLARLGYPATVSVQDFKPFGEPPSYRDSEEHDLGRFFLQELAHAESRSLVTLAEQLVAKFTPESARDAALAEAASRVFRYFESPRYGMPSEEIVEKRGRRILTRRLYGDSSSPWILNYGARGELQAVMDDIRLLLDQDDMSCSVTSMDTASLARVVNNGHFISRMVIQPGPGLSLVFFKDKIEFQFTPPVLECLQAAIATHHLGRAERV